MTTRLRVAILGSTGSIGKQALDVAGFHSDRIQVVALSAYSNAEVLLEQAREFGVEHVALADPAAADRARALIRDDDPFSSVGSGGDVV
jgi:1-deoxy-D-xylulose-5-phosphate reductoisomerase